VVRSMGVEEELLLLDPVTLRTTAVAGRALRHAPSGAVTDDAAPAIEAELFQQQIELATEPCTTLDDLRAALVRARRAVVVAADAAGALAVAVPTPVLEDGGEELTRKPRYQRIRDEFGEVARQALVCGMHVHVEVPDQDEAVAVLDGIRPWLPVFLALSCNSPFFRGDDTGYASWRSQVWSRWPVAGPREPFGSAEGYRETTRLLQQWGAALDDGMLYLDVRPAADWPTVELRVADVCTEVDDAVLISGLARGLVTALVEDHRTTGIGDDAGWRADLLRAAHWRAARYGMASTLVHPTRRELAPARQVAYALVERAADGLEDAGDRGQLVDLLERLLSRGTGAARQRAVREAHGDLSAVVSDLARRTDPDRR
jgi:carboxylate-amine ligase